MFVGMLLGFPLPLFPIQILWVNLATDGLPAIALGLDPADEDIMNRDPVKSSEGIFAGHMMRLILIRGVLTGLSTLGAFSAVFFTFGDIDAARTTAFMTLVLIQLVYAFECRSLHKTIFEIDIRDNLWLVASCAISLLMMLAVVYIPALSVIFRTVPLEIRHWVIIAGITALGPILGSFLISKK
jgi:Ca2+-transporting ATPase